MDASEVIALETKHSRCTVQTQKQVQSKGSVVTRRHLVGTVSGLQVQSKHSRIQKDRQGLHGAWLCSWLRACQLG